MARIRSRAAHGHRVFQMSAVDALDDRVTALGADGRRVFPMSAVDALDDRVAGMTALGVDGNWVFQISALDALDDRMKLLKSIPVFPFSWASPWAPGRPLGALGWGGAVGRGGALGRGPQALGPLDQERSWN